jgi:hypothetical protein
LKCSVRNKGRLGLDFGRDVEELGLALGGIPRKVVHLAAANEHRVNFSLTDTASSLDAGKGYELVLPGVHSNIGGSYGEVTTRRNACCTRATTSS